MSQKHRREIPLKNSYCRMVVSDVSKLHSSGSREGGPGPSLGLERSLAVCVGKMRGEVGGSSEKARRPGLRPLQWERNRVEAGWRGEGRVSANKSTLCKTTQEQGRISRRFAPRG